MVRQDDSQRQMVTLRITSRSNKLYHRACLTILHLSRYEQAVFETCSSSYLLISAHYVFPFILQYKQYTQVLFTQEYSGGSNNRAIAASHAVPSILPHLFAERDILLIPVFKEIVPFIPPPRSIIEPAVNMQIGAAVILLLVDPDSDKVRTLRTKVINVGPIVKKEKVQLADFVNLKHFEIGVLEVLGSKGVSYGT